MKNKLVLLAFVALPFLVLSLSSYRSLTPPAPLLQGVVISSTTGQPVANALVVARAGEEEALTNAKGEFRLETTRKLPLELTIEQWQYEKTRVNVTNVDSKLTIRLKPKS